MSSARETALRAMRCGGVGGIDELGAGPAGRRRIGYHRRDAAPRPPTSSAVVAVIMMLLEDSEHDWEDDYRPKWKHKELGEPIRWTGPPLSPRSPLKTLLNVVPTKAEREEHQCACNEADKNYVEEQLRKLPLLAQEYGMDTRSDAWIGIVERNDVWVLWLLLTVAPKVVPGFRLD